MPGIGPDDLTTPLSAAGKLNVHMAAARYHAGFAPFIILSGSAVHPRGTRFFEAIEMRRALIERYGVPAEMVVGIIGVETFYGQHTGNYRVLDTLTTLTLDFPSAHPRAEQRQAFFQNELGTYLKLQHAQAFAQREVKGSFAGAIGWPQFMPSSLNQFAVDFDGDGRIDLINSPIDAIGSVARYFQAFGWRTGMSTHYAVSLDSPDLQKDVLLAPDILPSFSAERMVELAQQL
mgnify:CR=1 FL=1